MRPSRAELACSAQMQNALSSLQELHKLRMSDALERKAARDAEVQDTELEAGCRDSRHCEARDVSSGVHHAADRSDWQ